jgi:hypothetical protein
MTWFVRAAPVLFALLWAVALSTPSQGTPPTPPATIELNDGAIADLARSAVGNLVLPVQIRQNQPVANLSLRVTLRLLDRERPYFRQPQARVVSEQRLRPGPSRTFAPEALSLRVPLNELIPGEYELNIYLSGNVVGGGFSDRQIRYIQVDKDRKLRVQRAEERAKSRADQRRAAFRASQNERSKGARIRALMESTASLPPSLARTVRPNEAPGSERLLVRPSPPPDEFKSYYNERDAQSWTSQDPVTVRGRLTYLDSDGAWKPLVNVTVDIWDEDWDFDEHLGFTGTDWDGRWSFSANNDDGWFQDGRDIYYSFRLENMRLHLAGCDDVYVWASAVRDDVNDGTVIDFGTETAASDGDSLIIWSDLNVAWNHAATVGGQDPGLVNACFPASGTNTSRDQPPTVNVGANRVGGDSPTHEYGHALMSLAYGGDPSPGGSHGFDQCNEDNALAWSEGWATGFMLSVRPDGRYNWTFGDMGLGIEDFTASCRQGEINEGWVAAAILDMLDPSNDGNNGTQDRGRDDYDDNNASALTALASMLRDTMWGSAAHLDVRDFWYALAGEITPAQKAGDARIMFYDWMTVVPPLSCVATKVVTARLKEPGNALKGLRRFRDVILKPVPDGRDLINAYYRNSPEMALILLQDPAYMDDALAVVQHFAGLGDLVSNNSSYRKAIAENREVIPPQVREAFERLAKLFAARGGTTLRRDIETVEETYRGIKTLRITELQEAVTRIKAAKADRGLVRLAPTAFSPESLKALEDPRIQDIRSEGLPRRQRSEQR